MQLRDSHARRVIVAAAVVVLGSPVLAWAGQGQMSPCPDQRGSDRPSHCEIRDLTVPPSAALTVDATPNGGVTVHGWNRADIQARAKIVATADTQEAADALLAEIVVTVTPPTDADNTLRIDAPRPADATGNVTQFDASFTEDEIHISLITTSTRIAQVRLRLTVPPGHPLTAVQESGDLTVIAPNSPVSLTTTNGTVRVTSAAAPVTIQTTNGDVRVAAQSGSLDTNTQNGSVNADVLALAAGDHVTCATSNGSIQLELLPNINANLSVATDNGLVLVDLFNFDSFSVASHTQETLNATLNAGGPLIDLRTHDGMIRITTP
jgi:hypothetical protein